MSVGEPLTQFNMNNRILGIVVYSTIYRMYIADYTT